jgi:oligoendopeptidase F
MQTQHFAPRRFLPETIDLTDTAQLAPIFDRLKKALVAVNSVGELETWLASHSEVCAALSESSSLAYIRMTCQTDDEAREKAYLHIVEVVDPWLKPRQFALLQKLVSLPEFKKLPESYAVYCRSVEAQVKIYREENVARETAVAKLTQQYQKISGGMTVEFEGKEQTLARMARIQEEPDRARREAAWTAVTARRL